MTSKITTGESKSGFGRSAEKTARCGLRRKPLLRIAAILVGLAICASGSLLNAQTDGPGLVYPANRYLVVVETSRAMQRHTNALAQIVRRLVGSNIAAQAHGGDTLGFWTYNEDVYTGVVPLQRWSKGSSAEIADRIDGFLKAQPFEKLARLDKVIPPADRLNKHSQFITVILICLGDQDVQGTPFDGKINQFFRSWRNKEQDAGAPFVIALRGQAGTFVDCTLNPSPWPVDLPALPKELLTPVKPIEPVAAATVTNKPHAAAVPPLIVSGHKHATTPATTSTSTLPATPVTSTGPVAATSSSPALPVSPTVARDGASSLAGTTSPTEPTSKVASGPSAGSFVPTEPVNSSPPTVATGGNPGPGWATSSATLAANTAQQKAPAQPPSQAAAGAPNLEKVSNLPSAPVSVSNAAAVPTSEAVAAPAAQSNHLALVVTGVVTLIALVGAVILWRTRPRQTTDTSIITESFDRREK